MPFGSPRGLSVARRLRCPGFRWRRGGPLSPRTAMEHGRGEESYGKGFARRNRLMYEYDTIWSDTVLGQYGYDTDMVRIRYGYDTCY